MGQSRMANRNLELLTSVVRLLRPMLEDLVFVGGCTTALLITDPAAAEVRPTYDVDSIAEIRSYAEYTVFSERLRSSYNHDCDLGRLPVPSFVSAASSLAVSLVFVATWPWGDRADEPS